MVEGHLGGDRFLRLAFEHLEQEREFRHLDGLRVEVHAVDGVEQDFAALVGAEAAFVPLAFALRSALTLGVLSKRWRDPPRQRRVLAFAVRIRVVVDVPKQVPVEQRLIRPDEERAGAGCGIEDSDLRSFLGRFAFKEFADGVLDDVADDVCGCVVDAACFADFGFFLNLGAAALASKRDDLTEELFVDLAEDFRGDDRKLVGGVVEV